MAPGQGFDHCGRVVTEDTLEAVGHPRRAREVETHHVREQQRVELGVREVEGAAEGMSQLVVEAHPGLGETEPGEPGPGLQPPPCFDVREVGEHVGQGPSIRATDSLASASLIAVASGAHNASTACATALSELVRVRPDGNDSASSGS